jgi:hypothetical protein
MDLAITEKVAADVSQTGASRSKPMRRPGNCCYGRGGPGSA